MTLGELVKGRIGALASGRVYCASAGEKPALPYIVWYPISDVPLVTHTEYNELAVALVQVDSFASTAAAADALRKEVELAMCSENVDTYPTDMGRVQAEESVTPRIFNAQADFNITYEP